MQANFEKVPGGSRYKLIAVWGFRAASAAALKTQSLPQENSERNGRVPVIHCPFAKPVLN